MTTYTPWQQRELDIASGEELDRLTRVELTTRLAQEYNMDRAKVKSILFPFRYGNKHYDDAELEQIFRDLIGAPPCSTP